jgi:hypothetical protein
VVNSITFVSLLNQYILICRQIIVKL